MKGINLMGWIGGLILIVLLGLAFFLRSKGGGT